MPSESAAASAARAEIRALAGAKGHAVDIARRVLERLDRALAEEALLPTPILTRALADLRLAVEPTEGAKLGAKSGEAARMILRVVVREIDRA